MSKNIKHSDHKIIHGQFFTRGDSWLRNQIQDFIKNSPCSIIYDPFAGDGHLFNTVEKLGYSLFEGCDIDPSLKWRINDSLVNIPRIDNAIIITNPPYAYNSSIARKKLFGNLMKYFQNSEYNDVYLIALEKMLDAQDYVVAIIPETFINSNFKQKGRLNSITILEENPFTDTEVPVCVVCFDNVYKDFEEIKIYKNDNYIQTLSELESLRLVPDLSVRMTFNDPKGWLALRGVDSTNDQVKICFDFKENIDYDWEKGIKVSSRSLTLINIDVDKDNRQDFIDEANILLDSYRANSHDISMSPFKGNTKEGKRRRRLDYRTARAILERAYHNIISDKDYPRTIFEIEVK